MRSPLRQPCCTATGFLRSAPSPAQRGSGPKPPPTAPQAEQSEATYALNTAEAKGFIGERFDADAGLQYLNARYYDPKLGMFLQPDWWEVYWPGVGTNRYPFLIAEADMAKRAPLTRSEIENMSALELVKLRLSDEEKRIWREVNEERELERQDSVRRLAIEAAPLLAELQAAGQKIANIGEMIMMRERYEKAIPILLRHLPLPYSDAIRATIARSLAVPEPAVCEAWPLLVAEYQKAPTGRGIQAKGDKREFQLGAKDGLACALAAAVTADTLDELITLAKDQANGSSRVLLVQPLRKSKDPRARAAIEYLSADPGLAKEIGSWGKK